MVEQMGAHPKIYLTSPVFHEIANHEKVSRDKKDKIEQLWLELHEIADVLVDGNRFPSEQKIYDVVKQNNIEFIGCHISHPITKLILEIPSVKAVCTSSMGFNHIFSHPEILITHTPSIMDKTVAELAIGIIIANLRNIVGLHNYLWDGKWDPDLKWDLDENLNKSLDNLTLGIIGLGEIGREVARRLYPWGIKVIYYDINRNQDFEAKFPNLSFNERIEDVFKNADIISLHIPLNKSTNGIINETLLKKMKKYALLVNTARGAIINFPDLIRLLKSKEISINLAFDVFEPEPIPPETLNEFKNIAKDRPELRFIFIPHSGSSDADTRAKMSIVLLKNLIQLCKSIKPENIVDLELIPSQRMFKDLNNSTLEKIKKYRIWKWWESR
ncbi:MAG: 2-hydroxyacid dehydrogenase [Promethearchaeota archaeon]